MKPQLRNLSIACVVLGTLLCACHRSMGQTCTPGGGVVCSPNLNLWLIPPNYPNWNVLLNANSATIDADSANWAKLNATTQTFTGSLVINGNLTVGTSINLTGCLPGSFVKADGTGCAVPSGSVFNGGTITNPLIGTSATFPLGITGPLSGNVNNWQNPLSYGVGSAGSATTVTATGTSGTGTLTTSGAGDFVKGNGVMILHGGAACGTQKGAACPTAATPAVTPQGTPGTTTYNYQLACIDGLGGIGPIGTAGTTITGSATLAGVVSGNSPLTGNYNKVTWIGTATCYEVAIYRNGTLIASQWNGASGTQTFNDVGLTAWTSRDLPASAPFTPLSDNYEGIVQTVAGTAATVSPNLGTSVTTATMYHDDTPLLQAAITASPFVDIPPGNYTLRYPVNYTQQHSSFTNAGTLRGPANLTCDTGDICIDATGSQNIRLENFNLQAGSSSISLYLSRDFATGNLAQAVSTNHVAFVTGIDGGGVFSHQFGGRGIVGIYNHAAEIQHNVDDQFQADRWMVLTSNNVDNVASVFSSSDDRGSQSMSQVDCYSCFGAGYVFGELEDAFTINYDNGYGLGGFLDLRHPWGFELDAGDSGRLKINGFRVEGKEGLVTVAPGAEMQEPYLWSDVYLQAPNDTTAQIWLNAGATLLNAGIVQVDNYGGSADPYALVDGPSGNCGVANSKLILGIHQTQGTCPLTGGFNSLTGYGSGADYAIAPTYGLNGLNSGATWVLVGTVTSANPAQGDTMSFEFLAGANHSPGNRTGVLGKAFIRFGNGSAAPNINDAQLFQYGDPILDGWKIVAHGGSTSPTNEIWDVYVHENAAFGGGLYSIQKWYSDMWTNVDTLASDPGSAGTTIFVGQTHINATLDLAQTFSATQTVPQLVDSGLTSGNCVQASTAGLLVTTGSPCGGGGGSMVYPGAGIANSTGSAWATSYSTTGTGNVVLSDSPIITTGITLTGATAGSYLLADGTGFGSPVGTTFTPAPGSTLQTTITTAGANSDILLSCGTYTVASGLTISSANVRLRAASRACTFINFTSVTGLTVSGANVEISGITFEGQTGSYSVKATSAATDFWFHDSAITQAGQGASTSPQAALWLQSGLTNAVIENNDFYGNGPTAGQPAGYTVLTDGLTSGYVTGGRFSNNHIHDNNNGIAAALFDWTGPLVIANNTIDQANAYFTSAEGTGYGLMLYGEGYNSSTTSLARVSNVVTIVVPTQPASFPYTMGETVFLYGYGYGTGGTNFNGIFTLASVSGTGPYTLTWSQVAPDDSVTTPVGTITPPLQHLTITGNTITNTAGGCAYLLGVSDVAWTGNELSQCDLSVVPSVLPHSGIGVNGLWGGAFSGGSIDTVGHSSGLSLNHTYTLAVGSMDILNANRDAILLFDNYGLSVSGGAHRNNVNGDIVGNSSSAINCFNCTFSGVDMWLAPSVTGYYFQGLDANINVSGGSVHAAASGTGNAGAYALTGTSDITFQDLQVDCYADGSTTSTLNYGIRAAGTNVVMNSNTIEGCAVDGILDAGSGDVMELNTVSASVTGINATAATSPIVQWNTLIGNTTALNTTGATTPVVSGNSTAAGTYPPFAASSLTDIGAAAGSGTACLQINTAGLISNTGSACGSGGGGGLPSATSNQQIVIVDTSGTGTVLTTANSSYNVVVNGGIDNTGTTDVSTALTTIITGLPSTAPPQVYLPSGTYKINSGLNISCTSTTCNGIVITGAGRDNTILQTNCSGNLFGIWFDNTTNSGDNWLGPRIEHLTIQDTSGTGACRSLLRMTQMAEFVINDVKLMNAQGKQYSTGTVTATNGSKTVTGSGTTWASAMVPGILWIAGFPQEICTFVSTTSLTLCSTWQQANQSAAGYALDYNGNGLLIDGGNSFNQYGSIRDVFMYGDKIGLYSLAEPTSGGTSRFEVTGRAGWIDGLRIADSIGVWLGRFSDTYDLRIPINETARGVVVEGGHANNFSGEFEENGTDTVVTTCNGGVASKACIVGYEVNSDSYGTGYGNTLVDSYFYNAGTAIQVDSANVQEFQVLGIRTNGGNTNNYNFLGTTGCPLANSGVHAMIHTFDCEYSSVAGAGNIAPVTVAVPSFAIPANTCYGSTGSTTPHTFSFPGIATTNQITAGFTANPASIVGWGGSGGLNIAPWPSSANTGSYIICNPTGTSITGGAITFSMGAK